jgi:hypothetical protein
MFVIAPPGLELTGKICRAIAQGFPGHDLGRRDFTLAFEERVLRGADLDGTAVIAVLPWADTSEYRRVVEVAKQRGAVVIRVCLD